MAEIKYVGEAGLRKLISKIKAEITDKTKSAVQHTAQDLTDAQKTQARSNIGAATIIIRKW